MFPEARYFSDEWFTMLNVLYCIFNFIIDNYDYPAIIVFVGSLINFDFGLTYLHLYTTFVFLRHLLI